MNYRSDFYQKFVLLAVDSQNVDNSIRIGKILARLKNRGLAEIIFTAITAGLLLSVLFFELFSLRYFVLFSGIFSFFFVLLFAFISRDSFSFFSGGDFSLGGNESCPHFEFHTSKHGKHERNGVHVELARMFSCTSVSFCAFLNSEFGIRNSELFEFKNAIQLKRPLKNCEKIIYPSHLKFRFLFFNAIMKYTENSNTKQDLHIY